MPAECHATSRPQRQVPRAGPCYRPIRKRARFTCRLEGEAKNLAIVGASEGGPFGSRRQVPDLDRLVAAGGREDVTVGSDSHRADVIGMASEHRLNSPGRKIPDHHSPRLSLHAFACDQEPERPGVTASDQHGLRSPSRSARTNRARPVIASYTSNRFTNRLTPRVSFRQEKKQ